MLNTWAAVGRVAKINVNRTGTGTLYIKFLLAVRRDKDRNANEQTDFINCAIVGNSGIFFEKYIETGAMIAVQGQMQSSTYEKNGQQITAIECFITKYNLLIPAGVKAQHAAEPAPAVPQKYQQQNYGGFVPSQGAPQAPEPPPVPDNLPPDPFAGIPFSLY